MKTTTKIAIKINLTLGCVFIAFLGFTQNINVTPTHPVINGEDQVTTIKVDGEAITWKFITPIDAYINNPPTIAYTNQQVNTLYLKPTLSQLESESFSISATATLSNNSQVCQVITVENKTKVWKGTIDTDWNNPNNWKPFGVPSAINSVIINANTIISGSNTTAFAKNITVKSSGSIELQSGNHLTVTDWINVNPGGIFEIKNNANLIQINDADNTGIVTIEKITAPMNYYDYTYWNSPVTFASGFTLSNLSPQTAIDLWSYTPTINGGSGSWEKLSPSTIMDPTKGYIVKAPDTYSKIYSTKVPYTANFIGTPNNGTILVPISKGVNANMDGKITDDTDEWNLIGNPYPSEIDAQKFLEATENASAIDGTIYIWTQILQPCTAVPDPFYGDYVLNYTTNDYASLNKTGATGTASSATNSTATPNGIIATGQSFFVKAAGDTPNGTTVNAVFNNSMRIIGNNSKTLKTSTTHKTDNTMEKHRIWLNLTNNSGAFSQTLIGYVTGATQGLDRGFDGESFGGNNVTFYSILPEAKLTIQGRALPFAEEDAIALGYNATKKGNYSIRIDHLDGLFENQDIYIEDKDLNIIHNLKQSPYLFNTKVGDFNNRFTLRYNQKTLSVNKTETKDNDIKISYLKNGDNLIINNNSSVSTVEKITVFTILGQSITSLKTENQDQQNIQIPIKNISSGLYIAKLKTSNGEISKKFVVN